MTFENVQFGRVALAVVIVVAVSFLFQMLFGACWGVMRVMSVFGDLDPDATEEEQQERMQEEIDKIYDEAMDGSSTLNTIYVLDWAATAGLAFFMAQRTARRNATSAEQGVGYGVGIGLGTVLLLGLCIIGTPVALAVQLLFILLIFGAAVFGGQMGGQKLDPARAGSGGDMPPGQISGHPAGENPETYYNMGVSAAMGGRREEARRHFTRVIQLQPRNLAAWLQLANLAESPDEAWQYVQQARAINPNDPAVVQAVEIIWPQVSARREGQPPPSAQPPYQGAPPDDPGITRGTMPGAGPSEPDADLKSDPDADSGPDWPDLT
jgi:tetratricopeptide (TPR) repeat protein